MAAEAAPVPVRLAEGAGSGLAHIVQQLLEQDQAEDAGKRRRAARLRGRVAMTASDFDASVTLDFLGKTILVFDGRREPVDASITGPQRALVGLLQGKANPLVEHWRGRLRVRSRLRRLFFPLRLHGLMKLREGRHGGR